MNWTYDPNQTGMPIVDATTGERICDMDCVDFYEICDDDESKVAEYEARRDSNGRLLAAMPQMLIAMHALMKAVKRNNHGGLYMAELMAFERVLCEAKGE